MSIAHGGPDCLVVRAFLRRQAEEALRDEKATLQGILDATRESIWLISAECIILWPTQSPWSEWGSQPGRYWENPFIRLQNQNWPRTALPASGRWWRQRSHSREQIIDKHNGIIRIRSSASGARRGTVFSVALPTDPVQLAESKKAGA